MSAITIGVNHSSSSKRIRFQKLSQRLQLVNVDIIHRVKDESLIQGNQSISDKYGVITCYFSEELEELKRLDTTQHFKRLVKVWTLRVLK